jgi:hypothetical protein
MYLSSALPLSLDATSESNNCSILVHPISANMIGLYYTVTVSIEQ